MTQQSEPSWGKSIGVYFLSLLTTGFTTAIVSLMASYMMGQGGYGVGGIIAWISSFVCAANYRSTGKVSGALGIAVVVGVVLGIITAMAGPALYAGRYGG